MIELKVLGNDAIPLSVTTPPVDGVISVNGKQGVVTLTAEDIEGSGVPTNVRQAIYTLLNSGAYATTGLTDEIAIVESWAEQVTALTISPTTLSLSNNTPQTITATVVPSGSTVSWSSSDTSVATVVGGVVTGVSNGSCTITASAGTKSATCAVTVTGFVELVSISAVYTQSGTVYDTDSLDSLRADLVVTATYSDSTTAVVTDYTLSGTLAVGTSTITVSYGGKTTTFSVTVAAVPEYGTFTPDNFVQGYYIESDGTVTASQWGSMSDTYYDVARGVLNFASSVNFRVSIYDSAKNFLRQVIFNTSTAAADEGNGTLKSHDAAITFTDDVRYFRLSWSSENNVEFTVTNTEYTDLHMEIGDIDGTTGEDVVQPVRIRSVDYIPVSSTSFVINNLKNNYKLKTFLDSSFETTGGYGMLGRCYDSSKNLIGSMSWVSKNSTVTLPTGTAYIRPVIQFGNVNIPDDFADYQWIPLILNSVNYRIVKV